MGNPCSRRASLVIPRDAPPSDPHTGVRRSHFPLVTGHVGHGEVTRRARLGQVEEARVRVRVRRQRSAPAPAPACHLSLSITSPRSHPTASAAAPASSCTTSSIVLDGSRMGGVV
eukprot:1012986-Rhodomonas_salina.1